jgi:hypothetical protein
MDLGEPNDQLLPTLLEICEDFLASTSPAVHRELDAHLRARDITGGPGWLIDMLALARLRLQTSAGTDQPLTPDRDAVKTRGD